LRLPDALMALLEAHAVRGAALRASQGFLGSRRRETRVCLRTCNSGPLRSSKIAGVGWFDTTNEANKPIKLKLRGVTVTSNGDHGLLLYGTAGAAYDLGTFGDPGNNTIQNPGDADAFAGVVVNTPGLVDAIGNTWLANQQTASASGKYVPVTGNYVEVTGAVATGQNYRIQQAGQTLRL
jgi:hypothetical protein